jgi:hypothetical protein
MLPLSLEAKLLKPINRKKIIGLLLGILGGIALGLLPRCTTGGV